MIIQRLGLREEPFSDPCEPKFFYNSQEHEDAFDALLLAALSRKRMTALLGPAGSGKTLLLGRLAEHLEGEGCFILQASAAGNQTLESLILSATKTWCHKNAQRRNFGKFDDYIDFVEERLEEHGASIIFIDDADHLTSDTISDLSDLSQSGTSTGRFLQILLAGSDRLEGNLNKPDLVEILSTSGAMHRLGTLQDHEIGSFITYRMRVAGASSGALFEAEAIAAIGRLAAGNPGLVSRIARQSVLLAAMENESTINEPMVLEAAEGCGLERLVRAGDSADHHEDRTNRPGRPEATIAALGGGVIGRPAPDASRSEGQAADPVSGDDSTGTDPQWTSSSADPAVGRWLRSVAMVAGAWLGVLLVAAAGASAVMIGSPEMRSMVYAQLRAHAPTWLPIADWLATPQQTAGDATAGNDATRPEGDMVVAKDRDAEWPVPASETTARIPEASSSAMNAVPSDEGDRPSVRQDAAVPPPAPDSLIAQEKTLPDMAAPLPPSLMVVTPRTAPAPIVVDDPPPAQPEPSEPEPSVAEVRQAPAETPVTDTPVDDVDRAASPTVTTAPENPRTPPPMPEPSAAASDRLAVAQSMPERRETANVSEDTSESTMESAAEMERTTETMALSASPAPAASATTGSTVAAELARRLVDRAQRQIEAKLLTTPEGNNAFETYRQLLTLAPDHPAAADILQTITNTYVEWARIAGQEGKIEDARRFLTRAQRVAPEDETVIALLRDIENRTRIADVLRSFGRAADGTQTAARTAVMDDPLPLASVPPADVAARAPEEPGSPGRDGATAGTDDVGAQTAVTPQDIVGRPDLLRTMIAGGRLDPNTPLPNGKTLLMMAAEAGNGRTVDMLLGLGASPHLRSDEGATALMYAAWRGDDTVVKRLIMGGATIDAANVDGKTALMAAAARGNTEAVRTLLANGAEVNARTTSGWTALMYAAQGGHSDIVSLLLRRGATPLPEDGRRSTASTDIPWSPGENRRTEP